MTALTQGYMSPSLHDPSWNSFAGLDSMDKTMSDNSFGTYGKHVAHSNLLGGHSAQLPEIQQQQQQQEQQQRSNEYARNLAKDNMASFFDFEPQTNPDSPFDPQSPANTMSNAGNGWNSISFEPLSPPDSAIFAPEEWPPYQIQPRQPPNITTKPCFESRTQYGQTTPPDDEDSSLLESNGKPQWQAQPSPVSSGMKKRKRTLGAANEPVSPPKRTRKNIARVNLAKSSNVPQFDPNNSEDIRRFKFLERNRVAASKCRQKKKEWTSNLETRARDLQKNNSSLRMMLGSLKDEIVFLKGEMLKHTSCGCEHIQSFLKDQTNDFSDQCEEALKKEQSPIGTAPTSRRVSFSSGSDRVMSGEASVPTGSNSPPPMNPEDDSLEALLASQLVHDTSDQGIVQQVSAVG